ncbi:MAG: hypothetical protein AB9872_04480 [Solidesulfovibrio sp.]
MDTNPVSATAGTPEPLFNAAASRDPMAGSVVKLVLDFGPSERAVATAFLVKGRYGRFLATAFHNVSGGISPYGRFYHGLPPRLPRIEVWCGDVLVGHFPAYAGGRSLFRVHPDPEVRRQCDVAVVDYALLEANADAPLVASFLEAAGVNEHPVGSVHGRVDDMFLPAGRDALVLGFPGGRDFAGGPIAVCCKIAAAPDVRMPYVLLSGPTCTGCSGAPALARDFGGYFSLGPQGPRRVLRAVPVVDQWLGLYSGRLTRLLQNNQPGPHTIQIGVVWTAASILEIGENGTPDFLV